MTVTQEQIEKEKAWEEIVDLIEEHQADGEYLTYWEKELKQKVDIYANLKG